MGMSTRTRSPPRLVAPSISCTLKKCSRYSTEVMVAVHATPVLETALVTTHDFLLSQSQRHGKDRQKKSMFCWLRVKEVTGGTQNLHSDSNE